jgi:hypothetical protein
MNELIKRNQTPEQRKGMPKHHIAGMIGAAAAVPTTLIYLKYGGMPSKKIGELIKNGILRKMGKGKGRRLKLLGGR